MKKIRNALRYLVLFALNVFVMVVFHSYINFILFMLLLLFPFYSVWSVRQVRQALGVEIELPVEPMVRGSEFYMKLKLHNASWFPLLNVTLRVQVENGFYNVSKEHTLNLPARTNGWTEVTYPLTTDYCGRITVRIAGARLMGLLGMYETDCDIRAMRECIVFPGGEERMQEAGYLYRKGVAEAMESREKGYDFSDISGIREYIPGDKLQNIHWKLSTKKDTLMVKERVSVSAMQLNVVVELTDCGMAAVEGILEIAEGICRSFVHQNLPFVVFYYSVNRGMLQETVVGSEIELEQWMEMLLYDHCYKETEVARELFGRAHAEGTTYLYISADSTVDPEGITGPGGSQARLCNQ